MRALLSLLLLVGSASANTPDLAALVDAPTPKHREKRAKSMSHFPLARVLEAAREFRPGEPLAKGSHQADLMVNGREVRTSIYVWYGPRHDHETPAPAIFYHHGAGGRPEEAFHLWQEHARVVGAILVAPTSRAGGEHGYSFAAWERADILAALRWARRRFNIDENRIHLTGVSRGGHLVWDVGGRHPDRWASLSPMIGGPRWLPQGGTQNLRYLENIAHLPIRDLQGGKDQPALLVNLRYAFWKLDSFKAPDAKFITFPDLGHSYRMEAVDWPVFLRGAKRDATPLRVVRCSASLEAQQGRSYWVEILAVKNKAKEAFQPRVEARVWGSLDAIAQRAHMGALVEERTARLEAVRKGKGAIEVRTRHVKRFRLLLSEEMFEPGKPIAVTWNGRARKVTPKRRSSVLLKEFAERFDRTFLPVAEIRVPN
ncbi:MAG: hypothetical protein AAGD14_00105 [Planctomycetota bacterium]